MRYLLFISTLLILTLIGCGKPPSVGSLPIHLRVNEEGLKVLPPTNGFYHSIFPDFLEAATEGWATKIFQFESLVRKPVGIVTVANDFVDGFVFPDAAVREMVKEGKIPLIRMMPRSVRKQFAGQDPLYTMAGFLDGQFDDPLKAWARDAIKVEAPLMVEFGPEVNGMWYSWNGHWNGGKTTTEYGDPHIPDGPERFRDTYRRIIDLFREEGVRNITWVFHIDSQPIPNEAWNGMKYYYPGDSYIDWIGVSVFGAQKPGDWWGDFTEILDEKWPEVDALSPDRPVAVIEWGVIERPGYPNDKARWIRDALKAILAGKYPKVRMVNYWHEQSWGTQNEHNFRLDSSPQALEAYRSMISDPRFLTEISIQGVGATK